MSETPASSLLHAAKTLLSAPVRGAAPEARFVERGTRLTIIVDEASRRIGDALEQAASEADASAVMHVLHRPENKPLKVLPPEVRTALASVDAAIFAGSAPMAERAMREQLASVVKACNLRHARLPDVSEAAFACGLRIDHRAILRTGTALAKRIERAKTLQVESRAGTSLRVAVTPGAWVERLGEIVPGTTVGFPAGALFTSPEAVDGTFVADASLGEFFGAREGLLVDAPVRFEIEGGRVVKVHAPSSPSLEADVRAILGFADNSNRIGLVVLGVNAGIDAAVGDACVDQFLPGMHIGLGDPGGKSTAVAWKARTSFAACQRACRVTADGVTVIDDGRLVEIA